MTLPSASPNAIPQKQTSHKVAVSCSRRVRAFRAAPNFQKPKNAYDIASQVLSLVRFVKTSGKFSVIENFADRVSMNECKFYQGKS